MTPHLTSRDAPAAEVQRPGLLADLLELSKPRITTMVLVMVAVGFLLGGGAPAWGALAGVLGGVLLTSVGASMLNQYLERDVDRLMVRTRERPLPAGRLRPGRVLLGGLALAVAGILVVGWASNMVAVAAAFTMVVTYVLWYTPLKRITELNTLVGAFPGALPPVIGWAAATGFLGQMALALFLILFVWQPPHFFSIAWLYRKDYAAAGLSMLTVTDAGVAVTKRQLVLYSVTLIPVSLYPAILGLGGTVYFFTALVLGFGFLAAATAMALRPSRFTARLLLKVSVIYLPILFAVLLYDARPL